MAAHHHHLDQSPGFSPAPETPLSANAYYSPFSSNHPLILPSTSTSTAATGTNTTNQRKKARISITSTHSKRRKSSNVTHLIKDHHHEDHMADDQTTSPLIHHKDDPDLELDHEDDENRKELDDDDYTVRKRQELINKDKLKILLENFDPQQMDRYIEYRNSGLAKTNIRKLANSILQQSVTDKVTIVIRGLAKVFVGHMVEQALQVQRRRGGSGPLSQHDLREAYRAYLAERDRGGSDRRKIFVK